VSGVSEHLFETTRDVRSQRSACRRIRGSSILRPAAHSFAGSCRRHFERDGMDRRRNKPLPPRCAPRSSSTLKHTHSRSVTAAMSVSERRQTTPGREPLTRFDPRRHLGDRARSYVVPILALVVVAPLLAVVVPSFLTGRRTCTCSCRSAPPGLVTLASSSCSSSAAIDLSVGAVMNASLIHHRPHEPAQRPSSVLVPCRLSGARRSYRPDERTVHLPSERSTVAHTLGMTACVQGAILVYPRAFCGQYPRLAATGGLSGGDPVQPTRFSYASVSLAVVRCS